MPSALVSPRGLVALLALVHFSIPFSLIAAGPARIDAFLTNDDTYYYLQTAWNARHLGWVTFDAINATNGVQFAWFGCLYLLSFVTDDKLAFLRLASVLNLALTCLPYVFIWRAAHRVGIAQPGRLALLMSLGWFLVVLYPPDSYLLGMESALHACVVWAIVLQYLRIAEQAASGSVRSSSALLLAGLLVLNTWARLDSVGLSACFLVLLLWTVRRGTRDAIVQPPAGPVLARGAWIGGAVIVLCGVAAQFGFFALAGDSLVPVSGLVKSYHATRLSLASFYNWSLVLFPLRIQGANWVNALGIAAMFASLGFLVLVRRPAGGPEALRRAALTLGLSALVHSVVTFGLFQYYYFWYLSASFVYWIVALGVVSGRFAERSQRAWRLGAPAAVLLAAGLAGAWWLRATPSALATRRAQAAAWMAANLEEEAIVGSFNAGQLGFFSGRRVVNLDGLINHVSYFQRVIRADSPEALGDYLDEVGVDYIVDYRFGRWQETIEKGFRPIMEFDLGSGAAVRVMKRRAGEGARGG